MFALILLCGSFFSPICNKAQVLLPTHARKSATGAMF